MMLGKRTRPPMKRTTSMSEFTADLSQSHPIPGHPSDRHPKDRHHASAPQGEDWMSKLYGGGASAPPRPRGAAKRNSGDFVAAETATFLKACGLCQRRLVLGREIFMYKGHIAFCSLECRQQQINLDEQKERYLAAMKKDVTMSSAAATTSGSEASSSGDMFVAA